MEDQKQRELYKVVEYDNPYYYNEDKDNTLIPSQEYIFDSWDEACKFLNDYYDGEEETNDRWYGKGNWYIERVSETFITFNSKSDGLVKAVSLVEVCVEG